MSKTLSSFLFILIMHTSNAQQTKIIAHRGAWKEFNLPENSIASLQKAIELNCDGAEFDVRMTMDGILVVNHDPTYYGDTIQTNTYAYLNRNKLSNGEDLPLLENYYKKGILNNANTKLICEIKAAINDKGQDRLATMSSLELAKRLKIEDKIVYISFSADILDWIKAKQPTATVLYLEADLNVSQVMQHQFDGINFHYSNFKKNETLAPTALKTGLKTGSWTVNEIADLKILQQQGVEWITTNQPQQFQQYLKGLKQ
jgi:glycerophosphoryl diester phosphodiesterase